MYACLNSKLSWRIYGSCSTGDAGGLDDTSTYSSLFTPKLLHAQVVRVHHDHMGRSPILYFQFWLFNFQCFLTFQIRCCMHFTHETYSIGKVLFPDIKPQRHFPLRICPFMYTTCDFLKTSINGYGCEGRMEVIIRTNCDFTCLQDLYITRKV